MKGYPRGRARGPALVAQIRKPILRLRNVVVPITDPGAAVAWGTKLVGGLPQGNLMLLGLIANVKFQKGDNNIIDAFNSNFALGTVATADATLAGGEVDLIAAAAMTIAAAGVTPVTRFVHAVADTGKVYDNTDGTLNVNLNVTVPDASITANSSLIVNGEIYLAYIMLGDD